MKSSVKLSGRRRSAATNERLKNTFIVSPSGGYPKLKARRRPRITTRTLIAILSGTSAVAVLVGEFNCDVMEVEIKNITSSSMKELTIDDEEDHSTPTTAVTSFTVTVPFIVNTVAIAAGAELVAQVDKKPDKTGHPPQEAKRKVITAFSQQASSSSSKKGKK